MAFGLDERILPILDTKNKQNLVNFIKYWRYLRYLDCPGTYCFFVVDGDSGLFLLEFTDALLLILWSPSIRLFPFCSGFELPGRWGIFDELRAPGVLLDLTFDGPVRPEVAIMLLRSIMIPVALIGPFALNPWFDLSALNPIWCLDCGPVCWPGVGAPRFGLMLGPMMLIWSGPPYGVAVLLAIAAPKLPTVEGPPLFEFLL